ncbi:hypothetical protein PR048_010246 [Dryococelus australis]|uniref:Uncharacterized protein n=1 Tax=Dryococelus australis TaxID=614101 RepID=A0ABQ9I2P1_9NEOP|nr:hypothetical protein PR048_010246 [Dryococelus australis]
MLVRGKREIPEKNRRPAASSGTIPTCVNPGATPNGESNPIRLYGRRVLQPLRHHIHERFGGGVGGGIWKAITIEVFIVHKGEVWSSAGMQGRGNGRSSRKPTDQRHRPAQFPRVKVRESNPVLLGRRRWLDFSPPTKANRVRFLVGSLPENRAGPWRWSAGFPCDLPLPPPLHSDAASYLPHSTLIGSQDLDCSSCRLKQAQTEQLFLAACFFPQLFPSARYCVCYLSISGGGGRPGIPEDSVLAEAIDFRKAHSLAHGSCFRMRYAHHASTPRLL